VVHGLFRHYRPLHTVKGCGIHLDGDRRAPRPKGSADHWTSTLPDPTRAATWRFALPHTTAAVPLARALVRNTLADIGAPVDGDTAELLTAELVANAVEHTDGDEPIELVVELVPTGGWQVEVHDQDPTPPGGFDAPGHPEGPKRPDGSGRRGGPERPDSPTASRSPAAPHVGPRSPAGPQDVAEHGRGLLLIRTLSADAGYRPTPYGKAVWFTLPPTAR
jgi:hypothetical protein